MRLRSTLSWPDRRMRTVVSTTRVSLRTPMLFPCSFPQPSPPPHGFSPSSVLCPVLLLQPLSSTSCLCKDADHRTCADPLVSRHPLTVSCTTKGSGGTKKRTMRYQFLKPSIFFFVQMVLFFSPSLPPALLNAETPNLLLTPQRPLSHWGVFCPSFFNHHWFLQRNSNSPLHHVA